MSFNLCLAPSIYFPVQQQYFKRHAIVLHFESTVNYAQSTKLFCDSAEGMTNENVITRPYHFS